MGFRPSLLGLGGRVRMAVGGVLSPARPSSPPANVKAAALAKNLRREQRWWRSCMEIALPGGGTARMRAALDMLTRANRHDQPLSRRYNQGRPDIPIRRVP